MYLFVSSLFVLGEICVYRDFTGWLPFEWSTVILLDGLHFVPLDAFALPPTITL
jgi:hypothetical protein